MVGGGAVVARLGEIMAMYGRIASCTSDLAQYQHDAFLADRETHTSPIRFWIPCRFMK